MVTVVDPTNFPSLPGLSGLPIFYMPAVVYFTVDTLLSKVLHLEARQVAVTNQLSAWTAFGACVVLVWMSLTSPTHSTCVEGTRISREEYECDRYEVVAGPDVEHALWWAFLAAMAFGFSRAPTEPATATQTPAAAPQYVSTGHGTVLVDSLQVENNLSPQAPELDLAPRSVPDLSGWAFLCDGWYQGFVVAAPAEVTLVIDVLSPTTLSDNLADSIAPEWRQELTELLGEIDRANPGVGVLFDEEEFVNEMTAVGMEIIGLAWAHVIASSWDDERVALLEPITAKSYLYELGRADIWQRMGKYNETVAGNTVAVADTAHVDAIQLRAEVAQKYAQSGSPADCIHRAINRSQTDPGFHDPTPWRLGSPLQMAITLLNHLEVPTDRGDPVTNVIAAKILHLYVEFAERVR